MLLLTKIQAPLVAFIFSYIKPRQHVHIMGDFPDRVCWPHNVQDCNNCRCVVDFRYVPTMLHQRFLKVLDLTCKPVRFSYVMFSNDMKQVFVIDEGGSIKNHPHIQKAIVHVLSMCMARGVLPMARGVAVPVFVNREDVGLSFESDNSGVYYACVNAWFCAARLRSRALVQRCLAFKECASAYRLKHGMARKIQRVWKRAIVDPAYEVCRKRLKREFGELSEHPNVW